jgi:hypothetical protein
MCGRSVPDGDGMELTDGSFYCISGGCQKKFLDRVVAEKVIPDMISSGGKVVLMADKPKFDLTRVIEINKPSQRVRYELQEIG